MEQDLSNYRKSYEKGCLLIEDTPNNPMELFQQWFYEVDAAFPEEETNAMTLATIGLDNFPKNRVVLLKKFTFEGFIFYTNYNSEKGKAIQKNPNVCLSFYWPKAERQIIIKGTATKLVPNLSDGYFASRPKGSQLGALISNQSQPLKSRQELEEKLQKATLHFAQKEIPRPTYWGGYLVAPITIEFWQGRANRLHDRVLYTLNGIDWHKTLLAP